MQFLTPCGGQHNSVDDRIIRSHTQHSYVGMYRTNKRTTNEILKYEVLRCIRKGIIESMNTDRVPLQANQNGRC
jgi:hypothetical protein